MSKVVPLTATQKFCMRSAIGGRIVGQSGLPLKDTKGRKHYWVTVRSLVKMGVLVRVMQCRRWYEFGLTEIGMLAAMWLEQESREGL